MPTFSERLKSYRETNRLSQDEMGNLLGVTGKYVSMIERGHKDVDDDATISKLLATYELDHVKPKALAEAVLASSPRKAVEAAMKKKGIDFNQLAKLTGYRAGPLRSAIEGGGSASERMLEAIAKALDLDKHALMAGTEAPVVKNHVVGTFGATPEITPMPGVGRPKYVPLITMAQAGTLPETAFTDGGYEYEGALAFDVQDPSAFAVRIVGDSMAPQYSEGDLAVVYPSWAPRNNDLVICRLRDEAGGDVLFKIYSTRDSGRRVVLTSYNPAYPPMDYAREEFARLYPVVSVIKTLRR